MSILAFKWNLKVNISLSILKTNLKNQPNKGNFKTIKEILSPFNETLDQRKSQLKLKNIFP